MGKNLLAIWLFHLIDVDLREMLEHIYNESTRKEKVLLNTPKREKIPHEMFTRTNREIRPTKKRN